MNLRNEKQAQDNIIPNLKRDYALMLDLFSEERDWRALCLQIAKDEPEIIAKYIKLHTVNVDLHDYDEILTYMHEGKKIQAIKAVRHLTGYGLKEAKDLIDKLSAEKGVTAQRIKNYIDASK